MIPHHIPTHELIGRKARAVRNLANLFGHTIPKGCEVEILGVHPPKWYAHNVRLDIRAIISRALITNVSLRSLELIEESERK